MERHAQMITLEGIHVLAALDTQALIVNMVNYSMFKKNKNFQYFNIYEKNIDL